MIQGQAVGLALGVLADRAFGDPARWHPVAGVGRLATVAERLLYADRRANGVVYTSLLVGGVALGSRTVGRRFGGPAGQALWTALVTWAALGGRSLDREAAAMSALLEADDLAGARHRLRSLCARDPACLDANGLAKATVESVAENTADAVVAPLLWAAVAGPTAVAAHRVVNTLDAMVGYRGDRYEHFGWAAARTDDLANWLPARLTAALVVLCSPVVGGSPAAALRAWRRDAAAHPSPNAGRAEASAAGALGLSLGGEINDYGDGHVERRPRLGDGRAPQPADIDRARRLANVVGLAAAVLAVAVRGSCRRDA